MMASTGSRMGIALAVLVLAMAYNAATGEHMHWRLACKSSW